MTKEKIEKIVEAVNPERRLNRNPLYNVALLLQNFPTEIFRSTTLQAEPVNVEMRTPLLDLRFVLLSHNTIRGAAGAAVQNAELLAARRGGGEVGR